VEQLPSSTAECVEAGGVLVTDHTPCSGLSDDTQALQKLLTVYAGGQLCFPSGALCSTSGGLSVPEGTTLLGASGPSDEQPVIQRVDHHPLGVPPSCIADLPSTPGGSHIDGAILSVQANDVTVAGLRLIGQAYGDANARNTHGIWAIGTERTPVQGLTVCGNSLSDFRGRGVSLVWGEDFVIEDNVVMRAGYSGINLSPVFRGSVRNNVVSDIGAPTVCHAKDPMECAYINSYGIVVSGCTTAAPCSEDVLIVGNQVDDVPYWAALMNHGGERILFDSNDANASDALYSLTTSINTVARVSSDTVFVNNTGDVDPKDLSWYGGWWVGPQLSCHIPGRRTAQWLPAGGTGVPSEGVVVVGNAWANVGESPGYYGTCISAMGMVDAVIAHNSCSGRFPARTGLELHPAATQDGLVVASNSLESFLQFIHDSGAQATEVLVKDNTLLVSPVTGLPPTYLASICAAGSCGGTWDFGGQALPGATAMLNDPTGSYAAVALPLAAPGATTSTAVVVGSDVVIGWSTLTAHDAVLIETRQGAAPWQTAAWRPADSGLFDFTSSNPYFVPHDPNSWTLQDPGPGAWEVRVRALSGSELGVGNSLAVFVP
jgi:hypothetical protein